MPAKTDVSTIQTLNQRIKDLEDDADQLYGALCELYHCVCSGGDVDDDTNEALVEARKAFLRHEELLKRD